MPRLNFVASNTRGVHKLLTRLNEIRGELGTDESSTWWAKSSQPTPERMFRELYQASVS